MLRKKDAENTCGFQVENVFHLDAFFIRTYAFLTHCFVTVTGHRTHKLGDKPTTSVMYI